jgi:hypothetical protein
MTHRRTALAALVLAAPLGLTLPTTTALAGAPAEVPLNPEPPDYYSCTTNGAGTYCAGQTSEAYGPEPTGIVCASGSGAFEVLDRAVRNVAAERWYDHDGNLVKRRRIFTFDNASFSSPSGAVVPYSQRDVDTDVFTVPGDPTIGTTYSTSSLRATVAGLGAVVVEKGRAVWGVEGYLDKLAGRHDLFDYFNGDPAALDRLCAALGD